MTDEELERIRRVRAAKSEVARLGSWRTFAERVISRGLPLDASVMTEEQAEAFVELAAAWEAEVRGG